MKTPRVFVTVDDGIWDLSALNQYGERVVLSQRSGIFPDEVEERVAMYADRAQAIFAGFDPEVDHLALVGDPLIVAIAVAAIVAQGCPTVPVLKYDRQERGYYRAVIDMSSTYRRMDHGCQDSKEKVKDKTSREFENGWG